jgi:hypothetical protein
MTIRIGICALTIAAVTAATRAADNEANSPIRFPSPDGRFALRVTNVEWTDAGDLKVDLIETASGKVIVDLKNTYSSHLSDTVLLWSTDSKRFAYATRGDRHGDMEVYFWNGSAFELVALPEELPGPEIKFRKGDKGAVKNYGGAVRPVRWLESGELELSSDQMMLSRESGRTYTGVVLITIGFDAQHHASIKSTSKTRTKGE